ncbi:primosomal protein N' [Aliagarivorans marinus]|uniref:primosomal protein N' n=1 Tax=Aliagarivorans marinus TaxID=561965 RepID=UPI00047D68F5|nr:primosomal protein N' [Aliagarivorans marinus]
MKIVRVALAIPLLKYFDYLLPGGVSALEVGSRVKVPFGNSQRIAVVVELDVHSEVPQDKLRPLTEILEPEALLPNSIWKLLRWASDYYHYGFGEVFSQAIPAPLRRGEPARPSPISYWQATEQGRACDLNDLKRAVKQQIALNALRHANPGLTNAELRLQDIANAALQGLAKKDLAEQVEHTPQTGQWHYQQSEDELRLNTEQALAVAAINNADGFQGFLLEGITGSGKTEVYLQAIANVLQQGKQVLVLVPEIGLTPQTLQRFAKRFAVPIVALHSGLNDNERLSAWLQARSGEAAIVIGTRSAVFTPLKHPGLIVIDEEHDSSFKQQDSFRYHARDLALVRGKLEQTPVILGSATPCLETLQNALAGRFSHLELKQRAGRASLAKQTLVDIRQQPLQGGMSPLLLKRIKQELKASNQVMLFLNRRGYAPALLCHECGTVCECARCDAYYTLHQNPSYLACHHCGSQRPVPHQCESCGSTNLVTTGLGTEQVQDTLEQLFPDYPVARIDRDSTRRKGSLEALLDKINQQKYSILLGTQMLAKGHHFPKVTLVALLDIDHALFSSDFRAAEKLAQLYVQVAGRAGRAELAGEVMLQSHHPEHELLQDLVNNGYQHFARFALNERQQTQLPPFNYQALLRFEAPQANAVNAFAEQCYQQALQLNQFGCWVFPATEAPQPRRAGKYRMQLLLQAEQRRALHQLLARLRPQIDQLPSANRVRWSLDVDPQDML